MLILIVIGVVAIGAAGAYVATTCPCENGFHRHRHWRFRRFRPGGCSAVD